MHTAQSDVEEEHLPEVKKLFKSTWDSALQHTQSGIRTASAVAKEAVARTEDGKKCWSGEVPFRKSTHGGALS